MKKILLLIFLFGAMTSTVAAQQIAKTILAPSVKPDDVRTNPEYPGGLDAFRKYVTKKLAKFYPNKSFSITVYFVVEKDGTLGDVAMTKGTGLDFDNEVIKIIQKSKRWTPATLNGEPVRVSIDYPITFNVTD